jgi:hypothetical protein
MCSENVWQGFLEWKAGRLDEVRAIFEQQNRGLQCYLRNGFSAEELLTGSRLDLNALMILESAFRLQQEKQFKTDLLPVLIEKHAASAVELAIGSPEYLHFAPRFRCWALQRKGDPWTVLQWQIRRIENMPMP